ncbi:MAG: SpoIIE family protein phosphatase [Acidobacteriaceae bacterium]
MRIFSLFALLLFLSGGWLGAQAAEPSSSPVEAITLGQSTATIPGPWKFEPGDSPVVGGKLLWAQPGFDDSHWTTMDLAPKPGSVDSSYGTPGFVPGWTEQGFPNLWGYAWYRLRLHVADAGEPLWIKMPNNVDDAYQVYANGQYMGHFGNFKPHGVTLYSARTFSFPLPKPGPDGTLDLAIRFYMSSGTKFQSLDAGGMHMPPVLGLASTVQLLQHADDDTNLHYYLGAIVQALLFSLLAPVVLWAWFKNRRDPTFLWLFLALMTSPVGLTLLLLGNLGSLISLAANTMVVSTFINSLILPLWIIFWWSWFGLRGKRWIPRLAWLLMIAEILAAAFVRLPTVGYNLLPRAWLAGCNTASAVLLAAMGILLLVILVEGFRRDRTEALVAVLPILLFEFSQFNGFLLNKFGFSTQFYPFGIGISMAAIAEILMVLVIGALVLRRFLRTQVQEELARQSVAQELEQAQQLQQRVLVPEELKSPFFSVQSEYRPAQTVGGDFFQTITKADGSLLVVIGDVSGKGISAAMLVAVVVGAIRSRAMESFEPSSLLKLLNACLLGRSGDHFATCLAAEFEPDGMVRMANAGHLRPYLNGEEMELEGSLPLGLSAEIDISVSSLTLQPGDHLTLLTDGVLEATNAKNELFGFERTQAISGQSPAVIMEQAQSFGQQDDITVLSVEFAGVAERV